MKKLFTLALIAACGLCAKATDVVDVISAETVTFGETYVEQEVTFPSGATYLITAKDEGDGPQFKAGKGGIAVKTSAGILKSITVEWPKKSNEDMLVLGGTEAYTASDTSLSGTELGTVAFEKNSTVTLDIEGEWPYFALTSTVVNEKACTFTSISITWSETSGISAIDAEAQAPIYYTLQGIQVANPTSGLYIRVAGNQATKVRIP
ncbi:MAG: hypothetical protein LIP03_10135 [Bacteroidales bacterium]|nr:hypothetical protein [Bacteroidales bacterium]